MRNAAGIIPLVLMGAIGFAFAIGLTHDPRQLPSMMIDRPLPDFDLPPIRPGEPGLKHSDLAGEVAMINVFGSWCGACRLEHPTLMRLAKKGAAPIYGVDWKDTSEDGAAWIAAYGDPYLKIGKDHDSRLAIDLGVTGAPETYIVDKAGRIRYRQVGPITDDVWEETIKPIIAALNKEDAS
jgi:cytochrome c biogenesis protein CcmG/thiol:disulfide interchange protein DsbE